MVKPKLIMIDIHGTMCGGKLYNINGEVYKQFHDHDFTAIKAFKALKIPVIFFTGDLWNINMADKRNVPIYLSVTDELRMLKKDIFPFISKHYNVKPQDVVYLADDIQDLDVLQMVGWPFCPSDSPDEICKICTKLPGRGGEQLVSKLLTWFVHQEILKYPATKDILEIDNLEYKLQGKFYVYKITNIINDKVYIGQSHKKDRWRQHKKQARSSLNCPKLYRAIRKYGEVNFEFEVLEYGPSESWALRRENELILEYNSHINGYNVLEDSRGLGNPTLGKGHSKETRRKISQILLKNESCKGAKNPRSIWNYYIQDPDNNTYETDCLATFCEKYSLNRRSMASVTAGKQKSHKGWTGNRVLKGGKREPDMRARRNK